MDDESEEPIVPGDAPPTPLAQPPRFHAGEDSAPLPFAERFAAIWVGSPAIRRVVVFGSIAALAGVALVVSLMAFTGSGGDPDADDGALGSSSGDGALGDPGDLGLPGAVAEPNATPSLPPVPDPTAAAGSVAPPFSPSSPAPSQAGAAPTPTPSSSPSADSPLPSLPVPTPTAPLPTPTSTPTLPTPSLPLPTPSLPLPTPSLPLPWPL